jgi:hypothetical protein
MSNPKPNLTLYFNLSPNITRLARIAGISRPAVYRIAYGQGKPRASTVDGFNAALSALLKERMEMSKKLSSRP